MFKNCFLFLVLVICIIVFPMLLNLIISIPAIFQVAGNEGDWIGFWGNYLGSIVAILGIYITMKNENKKQIEEGRKKVKPYILFQSVVPSSRSTKNTEFLYTQGYDIFFNKDINNAINCNDNYYSAYYRFINEGTGIALDVKFEYNNVSGNQYANFYIPRGTSNFQYHIGIKEGLYNPNNPFLIVKYSDIYGNRYQQKFKISVNNNFNHASLFVIETYMPELIGLTN